MKKGWLVSSVSLALALTSPLFSGGNSVTFSEPKQAMTFETGKTYLAVIHTSKGDITCELNYQQAPLSATNFIQLARGGFYNNLKFHRVVPNFVVQGGDPNGTGSGGPGYTISAEIGKGPSGLKHEKGALAWARLPDQVNPQKRSSGSQFYIALEKIPYLDGEYSVFGKTVSGMDVVEKIKQGDTINSVDIVIK
jgi:peptidyl-prolyl cis-trans isomerase B (cyclophilin B)